VLTGYTQACTQEEHVTSRWSAERGQPKSISETLARMAALVTRLLCLGHYLANQRIVVPGVQHHARYGGKGACTIKGRHEEGGKRWARVGKDY
jgi:hypothetical protein